MRVIELFAGIGSQTEALKLANVEHDVVAISEIDTYAYKVYEALHGKTNNLGDIKQIKYLPEADLWTYSFPCTDISLAGKMRGFEKNSKTRSSLLWEVERLLRISELNSELPKYLLMENVKNLVSKKFMPLFQTWVEFLSSLGYKNFWKVMNAKDYGIPQNRERVFMVSILDSNAVYEFPKPMELTIRLSELLEKVVDEKYYLSTKMIECFSDMTDRNGFIRGLRFKPHEENSKYAWTISTSPASRATDNYIIEPVIVAQRSRIDNCVGGGYKQHLEIQKEPISNALTSVLKDNYVIVPQNTKEGYAIALEGDGIYTNRCSAKRGVVQKNKIPTLKSSANDLGVVVKPTDLIAIRRLTPRECWRLMGWSDDRIDVAMNAGVSNTQLYKMAGNSIVLDCLKVLFENLLYV
jgi:DNA-methyltransferase (dcm)